MCTGEQSAQGGRDCGISGSGRGTGSRAASGQKAAPAAAGSSPVASGVAVGEQPAAGKGSKRTSFTPLAAGAKPRVVVQERISRAASVLVNANLKRLARSARGRGI